MEILFFFLSLLATYGFVVTILFLVGILIFEKKPSKWSYCETYYNIFPMKMRWDEKAYWFTSCEGGLKELIWLWPFMTVYALVLIIVQTLSLFFRLFPMAFYASLDRFYDFVKGETIDQPNMEKHSWKK